MLSLRSRILIGTTLILGIIVFIIVLVEINTSRNDLQQILREEATTLIETLNQSIENTIITNIEIEELLIKRLNSVAELASHLEGHFSGQNRQDHYYQRKLQNVAEEFDISHISIIDNKSRLIASSAESVPSGFQVPSDLMQQLNAVCSGEYVWLDLGLIENPIEGENMYMIARERLEGPGCVLTGFSSEKLLAFRKKIGIGKKIRDIGDNPNIIYAVLQDEAGIISASKSVSAMTPIAQDKFLSDAWEGGKIKTRIHDYQDDRVFEVVKVLSLENGGKFMNRIGLSVEKFREIQQKGVRRTIFIGIGIFITGFFLIGFVFTRERFASLKREHKQFREYSNIALNSVTDAVIAVDSAQIITVFNNAAENIFESSAKDMIGRKYDEVFGNDEALILRSMTTGNPVNYAETEITAASGKTKIIGMSTSFLKSAEGEPVTVLSIARDLTERKRMNELLRRKEKITAMGELAGGVAHEIRNPLNAINVIAQRFEYEFEPDRGKEDYRKLVRTVRDEVKRVNRIINQFLEFARPSKIYLERAPINKLLEETADVLSSSARQNDVTIENKTPAELEYKFDREKMKQVFLNLMQNAIDAMPAGGKLICSAKKEDNSVIIEITDTGGGIPEDIKSQIFDLYFTTKDRGTGLGLSIVHQIISEHNGSVDVISEKGEGTTFRISLPCMD